MLAKMSRKMCRLAVTMTVAAVLVSAMPVVAAVTYDTRALSDDLAPGTTGVYNTFGDPMIDSTGQTAFRAFLLKGTGGVTSANRKGLWSEGSGSLSLVARDGTTAPGTTGVYTSLDKLVLNSAGQVAFLAPLLQGTGGVTSANNRGIWSDRSGSLSLLVREGDPAAGTTGVFDSLNGTAFNSAGQITFASTLLVGTGGVTSANDSALWSEGSGSLTLLAREGSADRAPSVGSTTACGEVEPSMMPVRTYSKVG